MTQAMPLPAETLTLTGADAITFAQAQFSSDVGALRTGQWQWSAWLNAKGRVHALMQLARTADDSLLVLLRGGNAQAMAAELRRFVFRSKVIIAPLPARSLNDTEACGHGDIRLTQTGVSFGFGSHAFVVADEPSTTQGWRLHAINEGLPWLEIALADELLPPSISLELQRAVSFNKGCFPGQEIAARLHYLGGNKQQLYTVRSATLLTAGQAFSFAGKHAGTVLNTMQTVDGYIALSVIHDDACKRASDDAVAFDDGTLQLVLEHAWGP
jgi:folate-binding protein YgfZ